MFSRMKRFWNRYGIAAWCERIIVVGVGAAAFWAVVGQVAAQPRPTRRPPAPDKQTEPRQMQAAFSVAHATSTCAVPDWPILAPAAFLQRIAEARESMAILEASRIRWIETLTWRRDVSEAQVGEWQRLIDGGLAGYELDFARCQQKLDQWRADLYQGRLDLLEQCADVAADTAAALNCASGSGP